MRIAMLGSGLMGSALGALWARAGHAVTFSYSRDWRKLEKLARDAGSAARAAESDVAARDSDVVLVAVPWHRLDDALDAASRETLAEKLVLSCSLPMLPDDSDLALGYTTSGAEELARRLNGARVVSAFNTIPSEMLHIEVLAGKRQRPDVAYCGDDEEAKVVAARLIRDAKLEPVDAGPLRVARYLEPFGLLVAQLAYEQELGPELGYRFQRLTRKSEGRKSKARKSKAR